MKAPPICHECEKLSAVFKESQKIGDFLDWLKENEYYITRYDDRKEQFFETHQSIEQLLAEYFEIDLIAVEKERIALLNWIRENTGE